MFERKFFTERVWRFTEQLERTLYDAYERLTRDREARDLPMATADEVNLISWPQTWEDNQHGFETKGDTFDRATVQTHVVVDESQNIALVYHGGRFARRLDGPGPAFWEAVSRRDLPGAVDEDAWQALEA
ncbi:MAG: hypothetical protein WEB88_17265 [Gemmatimonadota bacterium]